MQVVLKQTTGFHKVKIREDRRRLQLSKLGQSETWKEGVKEMQKDFWIKRMRLEKIRQGGQWWIFGFTR